VCLSKQCNDRIRVLRNHRNHTRFFSGNIVQFILPNAESNHEKVKSRLNSGNACCNSVQNILPLYLTKYRAMETYPLLNATPRHEDIWGNWRIAPRILNIGIGWGCVVSFTPSYLYSRGKSTPYSLDRRLGGLQSLSGRGGEKDIASLPLPVFELRSSSP
jgi:hypothetical protein